MLSMKEKPSSTTPTSSSPAIRKIGTTSTAPAPASSSKCSPRAPNASTAGKSASLTACFPACRNMCWSIRTPCASTATTARPKAGRMIASSKAYCASTALSWTFPCPRFTPTSNSRAASRKALLRAKNVNRKRQADKTCRVAAQTVTVPHGLAAKTVKHFTQSAPHQSAVRWPAVCKVRIEIVYKSAILHTEKPKPCAPTPNAASPSSS
ncbi:hypothetical protein THICB6_160347 [Thiomonas arsenitoxydans]|nr:hypothetical protein THICB6_160347 [Thiomonas arsenitoxydans]